MLDKKNILLKKQMHVIFIKLKNSLYFLIPLLCICFWAFIAIYKDGFTLAKAADFTPYYYAAKYIFSEPEKVYFIEPQPYPYTPFFATVFAPMSLLTLEQAQWFYYFFILGLAELCLLFFNQILVLKKVLKKSHRFLFLLAISNGIIYIDMFDNLTARIFTAFGLLWFLKREIKFRELNKDMTNNKFIFTQMMILIFAFGFTLQYIFLIVLYLFHNVKLKEIYSKFQLKRYFFLIFVFLIQNFMLIIIYIISPEAIFNFLGGSWRGGRSWYISPNTLTYSYVLKKRTRDPVDGITSIIYVLSIYYNLSYIKINILLMSVFIMTIISIIIHLQKNLNIENKFGVWTLFSLFFYTFTQTRYFVGLLPMIAILLLDLPLKSNKNFIIFLRNNYLQLIGLVCIMILYFLPPIHYLIRVFPFLVQISIAILFLKYIFIYLILMGVIIFLNKKKKNTIQQIEEKI